MMATRNGRVQQRMDGLGWHALLVNAISADFNSNPASSQCNKQAADTAPQPCGAMAPEPPHVLPLKASATNDTGGELVSSKAWKVKLQQRGLYTGGKVRRWCRKLSTRPPSEPAGTEAVAEERRSATIQVHPCTPHTTALHPIPFPY